MGETGLDLGKATEKQKRYIRNLARRCSYDYEIDYENMTRKEADALIKKLLDIEKRQKLAVRALVNEILLLLEEEV